MCSKKTVYPLNQPVVNEAEAYKSVMSSSDRCDQFTAFRVSTSEVDDKQCVDRHEALCEVNNTGTADNLEGNPGDEPF